MTDILALMKNETSALLVNVSSSVLLQDFGAFGVKENIPYKSSHYQELLHIWFVYLFNPLKVLGSVLIRMQSVPCILLLFTRKVYK